MPRCAQGDSASAFVFPQGEVHVPQSELGSLLRTAEGLQVKGLAVPDDSPRVSSSSLSSTTPVVPSIPSVPRSHPPTLMAPSHLRGKRKRPAGMVSIYYTYLNLMLWSLVMTCNGAPSLMMICVLHFLFVMLLDSCRYSFIRSTFLNFVK